LKGYVNFPHAEQVFMIEREITNKKSGVTTIEIACGITSLTKENASAKRLLELNRGHWCIENGLHYVRDVTFNEDKSQIRKNNGAQIMASIRNLVINIYRLLKFKYIPKAIRYFSLRLDKLFYIMGI
jgi:predicted transposase YbfD/YdcC